MQVKPIIKYKFPVYPDREDVLKNPELLRKLPVRWRGNTYVAAALSSLLLMTFTACNYEKEDVKSVESPYKGEAAPLFVHGDGRGAFGCSSVAPPAFLSEEEAFSVIAEEAKREGIIFTKDGPTLKNIMVPKTDTFYEQDKDSKVQSEISDITLDGVDESKNIAVEFVSKDDIESWLDKDTGRWSSVETYKFLDTAEALQSGIKDNTGSMTVATFYDPHYKFDAENIQDIIHDNKDDYKMMEEKLKELVKDDLREQVRDFLSWLKGQGIV